MWIIWWRAILKVELTEVSSVTASVITWLVISLIQVWNLWLIFLLFGISTKKLSWLDKDFQIFAMAVLAFPFELLVNVFSPWSLFPALVMQCYCFVKLFFFISKPAEIIYFCAGCLLKYELSHIIAPVGVIHSSQDAPMCSDYVYNYWNKCKKKRKMRIFF